jgi:hypothetical protein
VILIDKVAAGFRMLLFRKFFSHCQHTATSAIAGLEDRHGRSPLLQFHGGSETGQTGAYHDNGAASKRGLSRHPVLLTGVAVELEHQPVSAIPLNGNDT